MCEFIGKYFKTSEEPLCIAKIKYTGLGTGSRGEAIKHMEVTTKCGVKFNTNNINLKKCLVKN